MSLFEELLIATILLAFGASVALAAGPRLKPDDPRDLARAEIAAIETAAAMYLSDFEGCPTVDTLATRGDLSARTARVDPWGRPYAITCDTGAARARSGGPDGALGTRDDP